MLALGILDQPDPEARPETAVAAKAFDARVGEVVAHLDRLHAVASGEIAGELAGASRRPPRGAGPLRRGLGGDEPGRLPRRQGLGPVDRAAAPHT